MLALLPQVGVTVCFACRPCWCCRSGGGRFHSVWPLTFVMHPPLTWQKANSWSQVQSGWKRVWKIADCVGGGGVAPPMQEVSSSLWWGMCVPFGVVLVALFVDFWWASGHLSKFFGEWTSLRNRMVLLWVCPVPSLPAQLPVHWVY